MNIVNQKLKECRINKGITQRELAKLANISILTIIKIEKGNDCKISTLDALFAALGYPDIFSNIFKE